MALDSSNNIEWMDILGLACAAADLRQEQIHTEWCLLVFEIGLELCNLLAQHVRRIPDTADDTETASIISCKKMVFY